MPEIRVGQGFDVHPFSKDAERVMILGGVRFDGPGLAGHSDADVIAHACIDALLGAAGLGDIGERYPDTEVKWAGADSMALLSDTVEAVNAAQWKVANVDCTVILETPRLAPHRAEMQKKLTAAIGAPVTVKGRRAEGLGALGRQEGVACFAVTLLERT
ncbi:MAG: 2-C-methyl-D-erythritol 2,4-cyclodiphosphate synthase [Acidimicrobiales bacterium]|jgi:2-C-methyl-D-erythritol 2,4-cyclodiphosphate synthase